MYALQRSSTMLCRLNRVSCDVSWIVMLVAIIYSAHKNFTILNSRALKLSQLSILLHV